MEALSVEVCPLPTALLSSQTDGFGHYYFEDKTEAMEQVIREWESLGLSFDAIYSGFLGSYRQVALVKSLVADARKHADPLVVVDPVLGDDQKLYGPVDRTLVEQMRSLVPFSNVITPNTTEAALLLGRPCKSGFGEEEIIGWVRALHALGPDSVVITSVRLPDGFAVACCDRGDCFLVPYHAERSSFPGSGDLFASILTGLLIRKESFRSAVEQAVSLTALAIGRTAAAGYERRHGVAPHTIIRELVEAGGRHGC